MTTKQELALAHEVINSLERLVREARTIILQVGESDHVPVQFAQHGWLYEVNRLLPIKSESELPITK